MVIPTFSLLEACHENTPDFSVDDSENHDIQVRSSKYNHIQ